MAQTSLITASLSLHPLSHPYDNAPLLRPLLSAATVPFASFGVAIQSSCYCKSKAGRSGRPRCLAMYSGAIPASAAATTHWLKAPYVAESVRILGTFIPVALAVFVSYELKIGFQKEILSAIFRSSIQLLFLGFALKFVFEGEKVLMCTFAIFFMVLVAGHTAGERAKELPNSHLVATLSLAVGAVGTLALMMLLRVFSFTPRYIIPTAGYVVGNSMSMVGGTLSRLHRDICLHQGQIEAALALGATPQQAIQRHVRRAVTQGMGPMVDSIKTAGLVSMPGSMTGMLMSGAPPLEAVQMQIQVLYMLLGASALSCLFSSFFGWRALFSKSYQLLFAELQVSS
ncbi:hypothetical protein O6H91_20G042700 [Diphasiastrum complanatum]|uniref:Uncharacterized protein n=2 Tax=Diphasiastrum complanatum TaxID=34168 RepID=A0ACC2APN4_DIPCM|nr:hypothetical protein O6H91_20G042700 [Diphasiastrum complanatum]